MEPVTGKAVKCDMCHERQDNEGLQPYCVEACAVNAIQVIDSADNCEGDEYVYLRSLPGVPKIQITQPSVRFYPLKMGRQVKRCLVTEGGVSADGNLGK